MSEALTGEIITRDLLPQAVQSDPFYAGNSPYQQQRKAILTEIDELSQKMEPWRVEMARLKSLGGKESSYNHIAKALKKSKSLIVKYGETFPILQLQSHFEALQVMENGPDDGELIHSMHRIILRTMDDDPDIARKAIVDLHKMKNPLNGGGGGGPVQIIINNEVMPRGALDK